jgi:hypothetical protein
MFNLQLLQPHLRSSVNKSPGITMQIIRTCMYKWRVKLFLESQFHLDIVWIWLQVCVFTNVIYLCNKFYKKCKRALCKCGKWGHKWDVQYILSPCLVFLSCTFQHFQEARQFILSKHKSDFGIPHREVLTLKNQHWFFFVMGCEVSFLVSSSGRNLKWNHFEKTLKK